MTKVIVRCRIYIYSYLLTYLVEYWSILDKILDRVLSSKKLDSHTLHLSRHLEFIIEQGHRVNWVSE